MTDTKRVDELEVGDIVIPKNCKGVLTVSSLEKITSTIYSVKFEGIKETSFYDYCEKLTYLGNNKKEEETMNNITHKGYELKVKKSNHALFNGECAVLKYYVPAATLEFLQQDFPKFVEKIMTKMNEVRQTQKVDCSALYPYFDALVKEEVTFEHSKTIPVYVRQQLKNIHELFEGVLGLTLEEVKTLYFERKMSKQESEIEEVTESKPKTKKVTDLCIGDKIFLFLPYEDYEGEETVTKLQEFSDTHIRIITEQGTEAILKKDKVVSLVD